MFLCYRCGGVGGGGVGVGGGGGGGVSSCIWSSRRTRELRLRVRGNLGKVVTFCQFNGLRPMAPLFLVTFICLRLCSHGFTCMDCSVATPLSKKWSK